MHLADRGGSHRHVIEFGKQLVRRLPQFDLDDPRTVAGSSAGTSSRNCVNSSANGTPTRSGRVLSSCPNLMNVGPRSVSARRIRFSGVCKCQRLATTSLQLRLEHLDVQTAQPIRQPVLAEHGKNLRPASNIAIDVRNGADSHGETYVKNSRAACPQRGELWRSGRLPPPEGAVFQHTGDDAAVKYRAAR